ncbi:Sin3-associated polypeptide Sap18, partial [Metarhizium brunneum ARSEF 3297]
MSVASDDGDRDPPAPFLVQFFYRNGGFYRADEFATRSLPPHISVYTWPSCTLNELALELAAAKPSALPYPAIGTRLSFQLVCPDLRGIGSVNNAHPRYAVKDLGSIVIGQNPPGTTDPELAEVGGSASRGASNPDKTLGEARFVVGDYISCAILPPLDDGSVAPASAARRDVTAGHRESRGGRSSGGPGFHNRENGFGRGSREGRGGRRGGGGPGASMPMGEWRRGERLPDMPPSRPRGGGGGRW